MWFIGLIVLIIGIVGIVSPKTAWYISEGHKFKDSEPSETALLKAKLGGVFGVIVGLVILFS